MFAVPGKVLSGLLHIAFDDYLLSVNVNSQNTACSFFSYSNGSEKICDITSFLESGMNNIFFKVQDVGGHAGLLYLLNISITV